MWNTPDSLGFMADYLEEKIKSLKGIYLEMALKEGSVTTEADRLFGMERDIIGLEIQLLNTNTQIEILKEMQKKKKFF